MKKLKKILLINWLYFSKELIEVSDVNFLTGKNGAGKSTVIDALQIVLLGETNARNFNQAANEKSQRTLDGYLRADMDENNPYSRRGKDFSSYIACEFQDEVEGTSFVTGVVFDCRSDGSRQERFFIYVGTLPENCFIENGEAMEIPALRRYLKQNYAKAEIYDTQKEYRRNMLSRWNVHNEQVLRMMKKAVSFRPIVDIQNLSRRTSATYRISLILRPCSRISGIISATSCWRSGRRRNWPPCRRLADYIARCIRRSTAGRCSPFWCCGPRRRSSGLRFTVSSWKRRSVPQI